MSWLADPNANEPFASTLEMMQAMMHPAYRRDADYRAYVVGRVARMKGDMATINQRFVDNLTASYQTMADAYRRTQP